MLKNLSNILLYLCVVFILSCDQKSAEGYYKKSIKRIEKKEHKKALSLVNKAIHLDSSFAKAYFIRAQIYDLLKKDPSIICQDYKKAGQLGFSKANSVYDQYCAQRPIVKYYKLKQEFDKFIKEHPDKFEGYYDRANLNFDYSFYLKAINDYNKAIKINKYSVAYFNRGLSYYKINQVDKACHDFKEALDLGYVKAKEALKFCDKSFN